LLRGQVLIGFRDPDQLRRFAVDHRLQMTPDMRMDQSDDGNFVVLRTDRDGCERKEQEKVFHHYSHEIKSL
jgi:hypothetical protein